MTTVRLRNDEKTKALRPLTRVVFLLGVAGFFALSLTLGCQVVEAESPAATGPTSDLQKPPVTLAYLLRLLRAEPNLPPVWLQMGRKLADLPGYERAGGVWLVAYLLALPDASNAKEVRQLIERLKAVQDPQDRTKLADLLEAMALDVRAPLYEKAGQRERAIADYARALALDPSQNVAKRALQRLTESNDRLPGMDGERDHLIREFVLLGFRLSSPLNREALVDFVCEASDYKDMTVCTRNSKEGVGEQPTRVKETVTFNVVNDLPTYVFSYRDKAAGGLAPSFEMERDRITNAIGAPEKHLQLTLPGDQHESHIVYWGKLTLQPLSSADVERYAQRLLRKGYLIDYSLSIPYSAKQNYPIFSVSGNEGVILNYRTDNDGTQRLAIRLISPGAFVAKE